MLYEVITVWHCGACGCTRVISFDGEDEDDYESCPECSYRTFFLESDETTIAATYERKGEGKKVKLCKHCGYRKTIPYTIPQLTRSSSSSSSGGSSSRGVITSYSIHYTKLYDAFAATRTPYATEQKRPYSTGGNTDLSGARRNRTLP